MIFAMFKTPVLLIALFIASIFGFNVMDDVPFVTFTTREGTFSIDVEVADESDERVQGLRNRSVLSPYDGMWFSFPDSQKRVFTMKDVLIPLDMVFIDDNFVVTEIHTDRQPAVMDELTYSDFPARYVLELGGGRATELGLEPGVQLQFFSRP